MERRRIVGSLAAAGVVLSGLVLPMTLSPTIARADDEEWQTDGNWNNRCDRDDWSSYCQDQRNRPDWRNDRDWNTKDWRNNRDGRYGRYDRRLSSGTLIPARVENNRRIVLRRDEDYPLRLRVTEDVRNYYGGRVVIPEDSVIRGTLVSHRDGYRFEADEIRIRNGDTEDINAVSSTLYGNYREDRVGGIFGDGTLISSAAAIVLQSILGDRIGTGGLSGSILGGVFDRSPRARRDLAVIYPDRDIDLRLTRDFKRD